MKIYFLASLYGKEKYEKNYRSIVDTLEDMGYTVQSDHVLGKDVEDLTNQDDDDRVSYYKRILGWINTADLMVADVTSPSSSLGHEITVALEKGKPVVALSYKGVAPTIFKGIDDSKFHLIEYDYADPGFKNVLSRAIKKAQKTMDIRFNFFISPEIARYLDWLNKYKRIPRSVYLRDLIENEMEENTEYKEFKAS